MLPDVNQLLQQSSLSEDNLFHWNNRNSMLKIASGVSERSRGATASQIEAERLALKKKIVQTN